MAIGMMMNSNEERENDVKERRRRKEKSPKSARPAYIYMFLGLDLPSIFRTSLDALSAFYIIAFERRVTASELDEVGEMIIA